MKEFLKSLIYALKGLRMSWREQRNLKIQSIIALITTGAGFYFNITSAEWCMILLVMGLVIGLETVNSAIESLVDLVTRERTQMAGKVKDIAAGAVLFASVIAVMIGVLIFRKYLLP